MTQDEIIRMAREAGFGWHTPSEQVIVRHSNGSWIGIEEQLERFAALVAAHEKKFWMEQIEVECNEAVLAEREKQAEQEPVAWMDLHKELGQLRWAGKDIGWDLAIDAVRNRLEELYAAPVRTKDLTEQEIQDAIINISPTGTGYFLRIARAVIAADREKNK